MNSAHPAQTVATWTVTTRRSDDTAAARAQLLNHLRTELQRRLQEAPDTQEVVLQGGMHTIRLRRESGAWAPGGDLQLRFQEELTAGGATTGSGVAGVELPSLALPEAGLEQLGKRLVGLEQIRNDVLVRLACRWSGSADRWSRQVRAPLPPALRSHWEQSSALFVFSGDPGTGKSALARSVADRYCRMTGTSGRLLLMGTEARGSGTVGDFGNRLRAAFALAAEAAESEPCFLVIDEADALAMRRSETQAHQEDRAGTATLLQSLDALAGRRVAVFLTTNLAGHLDPAVRRRGTSYTFPRPDAEVRRRLLSQWLPALKARQLERAVAASRGMTPADLERALGSAYFTAIRSGSPLTMSLVVERLRQAERTDAV